MLTIHVDGMSCGHCEQAVRQALEQTDGVSRVVEVNRGEGVAKVEGEPDPDKVLAAIRDAGYEARL